MCSSVAANGRLDGGWVFLLFSIVLPFGQTRALTLRSTSHGRLPLLLQVPVRAGPPATTSTTTTTTLYPVPYHCLPHMLPALLPLPLPACYAPPVMAPPRPLCWRVLHRFCMAALFWRACRATVTRYISRLLA